MSKPVTFQSWFAIPRSILRKNKGEPQTAFEQVSTPETRLFLHLLKLRRPYHGGVEIRNMDLADLVGLDERALRRARKNLSDSGLITHEPIDRRKETHLYTFVEAGAALMTFDAPEEYRDPVPQVEAEMIPADVLASVLNPASSLHSGEGEP